MAEYIFNTNLLLTGDLFMKKCLKCNSIFNDTFNQCPECGTNLVEYTSDDKEKDNKNLTKQQIKKLIVICSLIVAFFLGFGFRSCTGIKQSDYKNLQSENNELKYEYNKLSSAKDNLQKEYEHIKQK